MTSSHEKDNSGYDNEMSSVDDVDRAPKKDDNQVAEYNEDNEEDERPQWSNHMEFILSIIGYAVGLGNVWRFPYQCYKYGGGAFLVAYWFLGCCIGFPLIFLEQSLGQYTSQSPMHCYVYAPIVRGIGWSMTTLSTLTGIYYNVIIAWALYMLFASFQSTLPFSYCDHGSWATYRCELRKIDCNGTTQLPATDGLCYNVANITKDAYSSDAECFENATSTANATFTTCLNFNIPVSADTYRKPSVVDGFWNGSLAKEHGVSARLSTEEYFYHQVLGKWPEYNTENIGTPQWGLALSLLMGWILVYLCLLNGIKSAGKVVWFTAIFPYVIIIILIGRGCSLPGAEIGIKYYLTPDWSKLEDVTVWYAAANQLFFSLGAGWGGMIALASYNPFKNNVLRDAVIAVVADSLTSFTAGFAIFSVIGHGAYLAGQDNVDGVAQAGTGLAFVMYPKILMTLPGSVFWSIMFFFMLLLLGLDSEFNVMETVLTALYDTFPWWRQNMKRKAVFMAFVCSFFYILGLPMICNGGVTLIDVVDGFSSGWGALLIGFSEALSIAWLYGFWNYHEDLLLMVQRGWYGFGKWYIMAFWGIISPGLIFLILMYNWATYKRNPDLTNTDEGLGWCCTIAVLIWIPLFAVYSIVTAEGDGFVKKLKRVCKPAREWGPYLVKYRREVKHLGSDFDIDPRGKIKKFNEAQAKKSQEESKV